MVIALANLHLRARRGKRFVQWLKNAIKAYSSNLTTKHIKHLCKDCVLLYRSYEMYYIHFLDFCWNKFLFLIEFFRFCAAWEKVSFFFPRPFSNEWSTARNDLCACACVCGCWKLQTLIIKSFTSLHTDWWMSCHYHFLLIFCRRLSSTAKPFYSFTEEINVKGNLCSLNMQHN